MDQHPYLPIVVTIPTEAQRKSHAYDDLSWKRICSIGRVCNVKVPHHGKGGHDGIKDMPEFTRHECKEHCVWVFWR